MNSNYLAIAPRESVQIPTLPGDDNYEPYDPGPGMVDMFTVFIMAVVVVAVLAGNYLLLKRKYFITCAVVNLWIVFLYTVYVDQFTRGILYSVRSLARDLQEILVMVLPIVSALILTYGVYRLEKRSNKNT